MPSISNMLRYHDKNDIPDHVTILVEDFTNI